jgi:hypothetical protein
MIPGLGGMIAGGVQGLTGIAGGIIGSGARKREQRAAQHEFNTRKAQYEMMDTSNLYKNMENVYEDLTVNQQEANFISQKQDQGMANIMGSMQGAAGGSGIAALAQSLANQQSQNAQQAAVSIGSQEAGNQMAERGMAAKLQVMEREGEQASRDAEKDKTETLLGMAQQRLGAANAARAAATKSIVGGVGNLVGAGASLLDAKGGMDAANMTPGGAG